jgi:hypothetical protein
MKENTYINKKSIFTRIENGELSEEEKDDILKEFEKHLNSPYGTPGNYHKKAVVEALLQKYSDIIDTQEIQQFTRMKINRIMNKIWNLIENNQRVNVQPTILQMLLNYAKGVDDASVGTQVIVENNFVIGNNAPAILPEPKESI